MLTRHPDFSAPELLAHDATDRLLLETAAGDIAALLPGELVVIGDRHGALTLGAIHVLGARGVRTHQDALLGERALAQNTNRVATAHGPADAEYASHPLDASLLLGARVVLLQLPRSLDELDEIAGLIRRHADPAVVVCAGGRVKHMTRAMNTVFSRYFSDVQAGLGQRKSRVLTVRGPLPDQGSDAGLVAGSDEASGSGSEEPRFPVWGEDRHLSFRVAAFGATFGGATLDHGSRLLLSSLDKPGAGSPHTPGAPGGLSLTAPRRIVDLGCGNGVLAVAAALRWSDAQVIATDQSAAAVAATTLTAEAAGVSSRVEVHRADATEAVPEDWADLILLNPPFHTGATVHTGVAHRLMRSCKRALAPGGELRIVFNSSLGYRPLVEREIGHTTQLARDRTFTVLSARR